MSSAHINAAVEELRSNGYLSEKTLNDLNQAERQLVADLAGEAL